MSDGHDPVKDCPVCAIKSACGGAFVFQPIELSAEKMAELDRRRAAAANAQKTPRFVLTRSQ